MTFEDSLGGSECEDLELGHLDEERGTPLPGGALVLYGAVPAPLNNCRISSG